MQLLLIGMFAFKADCNSTTVPSACADLLPKKCMFEKYEELSYGNFQTFKNTISATCTSECLQHQMTANECIKNTPDYDVTAKACKYFWNTFCNRLSGKLCYNERLEYYQTQGIVDYTGFQNAIANKTLASTSCSDCEKQTGLFEMKSNDFINSYLDNKTTFIGSDQYLRSYRLLCGQGFYNNINLDFESFISANATVSAVTKPSRISSDTVIILCSVLPLGVLIVLGYLYYKKKKKDLISTKPSQLMLPQVQIRQSTNDLNSGTLVASNSERYYISVPQ